MTRNYKKEYFWAEKKYITIQTKVNRIKYEVVINAIKNSPGKMNGFIIDCLNKHVVQKTHTLKIRSSMWKMISKKKPIKIIGVRNMIKDFIKINDTIRFINLTGSEIYGECFVVGKRYFRQDDGIKYPEIDLRTREFINDNYLQNQTLIIFYIVPIENKGDKDV
jgi:hypothetical protein